MSASLPPHAQVPGGEEEIKNIQILSAVPHVFIASVSQKLCAVGNGYGNCFTDGEQRARPNDSTDITQEVCREEGN